jgi:uncharacterized membrane protein
MTRWFYLSVLLTAAAAAFSLYLYLFAYDRLPERIPIHWDLAGEADGYAGRGAALLVTPLAMLGLVGLTLLLPWLSPKQFEVDAFRTCYEYVMMLIVALVGYIHVLVLWGSLRGEQAGLGRWLVAGLFLFFALLGNVLGQVRRNFWMGVRTPWTLASESVWIRTHRLAAWLFVAAGVFGFAATLLGVPLAWCFAGILAAALLPAVYSLVLYKRLERQGKL